MPRVNKPFLCGLSLSSLFFYPLTMSMYGNGQYSMSWKVINTLEYICTFSLLAMVFVTVIYFISFLESRFLRTLFILIASFLPLSVFSIHLLRQFFDEDVLLSIRKSFFSTYGLFFAGALLIVLLYKRKILFSRLYETIENAILSLSPLIFFVPLFVILYGFDGHEDKLGNLSDLSSKKINVVEKNNIHIFLFDELDYFILYDSEGNINRTFKNIWEFSNNSTNYHNARSPDIATLKSIPQLLTGQKINNIKPCDKKLCSGEGNNRSVLSFDKNLFKLAQERGFKTALLGWSHRYCEQYHADLDFCRSYGLYNYSAYNRTFSLLNPIYTNINLLPAKMPFGLLKNSVYSRFHHSNVINVQDLNLKIIKKAKDSLTFNFVHYPIPHLPYIYRDNIFKPGRYPFEQTLENYEEQLIFVDKLFGELLEEMKKTSKIDRSTIVLLSDHGFRKILPKKDWGRVPMIIFKGNNPKKEDIFEEVSSEKVIENLVKELEQVS